jgi:hypothetical protein
MSLAVPGGLGSFATMGLTKGVVGGVNYIRKPIPLEIQGAFHAENHVYVVAAGTIIQAVALTSEAPGTTATLSIYKNTISASLDYIRAGAVGRFFLRFRKSSGLLQSLNLVQTITAVVDANGNATFQVTPAIYGTSSLIIIGMTSPDKSNLLVVYIKSAAATPPTSPTTGQSFLETFTHPQKPSIDKLPFFSSDSITEETSRGKIIAGSSTGQSINPLHSLDSKPSVNSRGVYIGQGRVIGRWRTRHQVERYPRNMSDVMPCQCGCGQNPCNCTNCPCKG